MFQVRNCAEKISSTFTIVSHADVTGKGTREEPLRASAWEATLTFPEENQFDPNSLCINTEGLLLYRCFLRQYVIFITDVDECESAESNECHFYASCNNTEGSYTCRCLDGYQGDGKNCTGKYLLSLPELTCEQSYKETAVLFLLSKLSLLAVLHLVV